MKKLASLVIVIFALTTCVTNRPAMQASVGHSAAIRDVALGQTMFEVHQVMMADPETRTRRVLPDGRNQEEWGYVTDYGNDVITQITFTDRKVTEIRQMAWRGEFAKGTIAAGEDLRSDEDRARETNTQKNYQSNIDNATAVVKIGVSAAEVRRLLGAPSDVHVYASNPSAPSSVEQTYKRSDGSQVKVTIRADHVTDVAAQ